MRARAHAADGEGAATQILYTLDPALHAGAYCPAQRRALNDGGIVGKRCQEKKKLVTCEVGRRNTGGRASPTVPRKCPGDAARSQRQFPSPVPLVQEGGRKEARMTASNGRKGVALGACKIALPVRAMIMSSVPSLAAAIMAPVPSFWSRNSTCGFLMRMAMRVSRRKNASLATTLT